MAPFGISTEETLVTQFDMDDKQQPGGRKHRSPKAYGAWIAVGIAVGAAFGIAIGNLAVGIGVGLALGIGLGEFRSMRKK